MSYQKAAESIVRLLDILATLRSPDGCPWDVKQTSASLRPYLLEETHEVLEAISGGNPEEICSELGDLLLQIIFQARIFEENGEFDFSAVVESISEKLVRRHPHVFSPPRSLSEQGTGHDLDRQWQEIKDRERKGSPPGSGSVNRIPATLPSLARAAKILGQISLLQKEKSQVLRETLLSQAPLLLEKLFPHSVAPSLTEKDFGKILLFLVEAGARNNLDAEEALRSLLFNLETSGTLE